MLDGQGDLLAGLFENLSEGVLVLDETGTLIFQNKKAFPVANLLSQSPDASIWQPVEGTPLSSRKLCEMSEEGSGLHLNLECGDLFFIVRAVRIAGFTAVYLQEPKDGLVDELEAEILRLRESILTRDTLLSIIGHDLRSPIFQLNGLLFRLRQMTSVDGDPELIQYTSDLEERIYHLTNAMENLLQWASSQWGRIKPVTSCFLAADVLENVVELLRPVAEGKKVTLVLEMDDSFWIETDREMFSFVVRNLLSNAIKFSHSGQDVLVQSGMDEESCRVSVIDTGIGIEKENLSRIAKPHEYFTRMGSVGEQGTGIGLKLCFQFAELLGGNLVLDSEPNTRTEARFVIPAKLEQPVPLRK